MAVVSREAQLPVDVYPQLDHTSYKLTGTISTVELMNDLWTCPLL